MPQTFAAKQPENVIPGKYRNPGSTDWAVLCSREGFSSVLVFWGGSADSIAELGRHSDVDYLQTFDSTGNLGYSRVISTASPDRILRRKQNGKAGPFDHDGIDDGFEGKGSLIYYFRGGHWIELEGAD